MSDEKKEVKVEVQTKKVLPKSAASRPTVTVYSLNGKATKKTLPMPDIMLAPIRADLVNFVHTNMAKNNRQPYAVQNREGPHGIRAGHQVAAKSWGTGRAVSRVPRVKGGGTHRAGQGAYANMCRGGRMFAPTKVWRKWHRKINTNQKRFAVCSAVAASAVPALVMARGHRIQSVDEIPLVIESDFQSLKKTKAALNTLRDLKLSSELKRCKRRYMRAGRGKSRNRRWKHRLGPLVIFEKNDGLCQSIRNIRGVDFCNVYSLNLLKLAPGGHVGRLIIWTECAFQALNDIYGTKLRQSVLKHNYQPPRSIMTNSDLQRIINSQEIQSVLRAKRGRTKCVKKRNPLRNPELYAKLNPLFEEHWNGIKDNYKPGAKPRTTTLLKPLRKKQKVEIKITDEEKEQMKGYWKNVFGEDKIFKTAELLKAEKAAVKAAILAQEREKAGLDLKEALAAKNAAAEAAGNDSD
mmetsp:Transcript_15807/g.25083  ORF Transcript_15807/g.25083 Transcript_15807/m.25083 type:complete len:464 (+) Transcript_15807:25-1416(+)|eukprot:CAMPEP_0197079022 /NCGR_PEP_ID=MMETSP1384-20130603/213414_1 /TAXON_ID=29189 /ORGANISM="Ammonia sp." /LENGTH=463 /DNA_ID=CAMNT_0042517891 /DNA_START=25 /DNA_END=1416 /DNA_ORIENTATION=+